MVLETGMPNPRCQYVTVDQRLRLTNGSDRTVDVTIGGVSAALRPGETRTIGARFGDYLAPGVHIVHTSLYGGSGPELWLR